MKIFCITAKSKTALAASIVKKKREGMARYGRPVKIGSGAVVQMMVERQITQGGQV